MLYTRVARTLQAPMQRGKTYLASACGCHPWSLRVSSLSPPTHRLLAHAGAHPGGHVLPQAVQQARVLAEQPLPDLGAGVLRSLAEMRQVLCSDGQAMHRGSSKKASLNPLDYTYRMSPKVYAFDMQQRAQPAA